MSKRGKRGVASCLKKMRDDERHIEFDENMLPTGPNKSKFSSWLGLTLRKRFPYYIDTSNFEKQMWEDLWLYIKKHWHILEDEPKQVLIKKAKKNCTNWRSKLVTQFVNMNKLPFAKYHYLDQSKWNDFVASKTSNAFLKKSKKAKLSALKKKDHPRTGRNGYSGLKEKFKKIWTQLLANYQYLEEIENDRTQRWVSSRARLNKQTGLYEVEHIQEKIIDLILIETEMKADGTYYEGRDDPITRYFGPEHGGRSRLVSSIIGSTKVHKGLYKGCRQPKMNDVPTTQIRSDERVNVNRKKHRVDASPDFQTPEQELGVKNATHVHDAGSGVIASDDIHEDSPFVEVEHEIIISQTRESEDGVSHQKRKRGRPPKSGVKNSAGLLEELVITGDVGNTRDATILVSDGIGSKGNIPVVVLDDIHQDSPSVEHEINITQARELHHDLPNVEPEIIITTRESEYGMRHQKKKRRTPPKSVVTKPTSLPEGSSGLGPSDHYGISLIQASAEITTDYQQDWPFIKRSPMWALIELYSQKPHFAPLKEMNEDCREGLAIAHIVTFGNLVQRLSDFKPDDPVDLLNNSLKTLSDLETHGFDVGPVRRRLKQLLSLKTKMCEQEDTRREAEKELEKCNHEKCLMEKEMDELKVKMRLLKSKSQQAATMQKAKEEELMKLELDFNRLAATPL